MQLRQAMVEVLRDGHQVEHGDLEVSLLRLGNGKYMVEVHDPLDMQTGEPLNRSWSGLALYKLMGRDGDFSQREFPTPHRAVDFYLALIEEAQA